MERKLATVVAMDVVGYSRLMEIDEAGTLQRLKEVQSEVLAPAVGRHGGRIVKLMGDGILGEFASVVDALQCAVEVQRQLAVRNSRAPQTRRLQLRIGLHLGDVIIEGDDIYGDGVNVAARLEALAEPGGIVLSKQVHDHIGANVPVRLVSLGEQSVKNIARPIQAYRVDLGMTGDGAHLIRFRDFELDTHHFELREKGERVPVEPQVFDLLVLLARNANRTVTKEEIFGEIWGDRIVSESALSSQIKAARRAVGDDGAAQHTIATVHGRGFRFVAPIRTTQSPVAAPEEGRPVTATKPTAAVLPFTNLNADPSEDYLADGINGERVVDVGCGTGSVTFLMPERAAVRRIDAVDFSDVYLSAATEFNHDPRIHFHRGDAHRLAFDSGSFDRAVSLLLLHVMPEPEEALREMCRVVRPGGVIAAAVWDVCGGVSAHRMFWDTVFMVDAPTEAVRRQALLKPMTRRGDMKRAFVAAGLTDVRETALLTWFDYGDFDDYWSPIAGGEGSLGKYFASQPEHRKPMMASAVEAAYLAGEKDGPRSFAALAWACRGVVCETS